MQTEYTRYVILLNNIEGRASSEALIRQHVQYLRDLEKINKLVLCGPFTNYKGGMVIVKAKNLSEAQEIAQNDPFISNQIKSYEVRAWELSCEENNHLAMG